MKQSWLLSWYCNKYLHCLQIKWLNNSEDVKIRDTTTPDFTAQNCLFGGVKNDKRYKYFTL